MSSACAPSEEPLRLTVLHINDVYEITAIDGGKVGGPARLATLRDRLKAENPHTIITHAGDALSPSALGTAKVNGKRLAGAQMVAVLNALDVFAVTVGNHEFDLNEQTLALRLKEARFPWLSANVLKATGEAFSGVRDNIIYTVKSPSGQEVRFGFFGLTINTNKKKYVQYLDYTAEAKKQVAALKEQKADVIIALTHLKEKQDRVLAQEVAGIDLILGGHEHHNMNIKTTPPIFKADANIRTAWRIHLDFYPRARSLLIGSELKRIDDSIPRERELAKVVDHWVQVAAAGFQASGFRPGEVIGEHKTPLDGLDRDVRTKQTELTRLVAAAFLRAGDKADLAMFNAGTIRLDDTIPPGKLTQYDVLRILPFGGPVITLEMSGKILRKALRQGEANRGTGGYLQYAGVSTDDGGKTWLIKGKALDENTRYRVAGGEYLFSGKQRTLEFLKPGQAGVKLIKKGRDIRFALIDVIKGQGDL